MSDEDWNPNSPAGQIGSTGQFALGLTRLTGWRRQLVRWLVVALFAVPLALIVISNVVR
jgi:hypothetical protein